MSLIRVCFVIDSLAHAGTEKQLCLLLRHLDRTRIQPYLVLLKETREPAIIREEMQAELPGDCSLQTLGIEKIFSANTWKKGREFRRFLRAEKINIVQTYFPDSTLFAALFAKYSGINAIFGARRDVGHWMTPKSRLISRFLNRFFIDKVLVNAKACSEAAKVQDWTQAKNIIVIPNGIELDRFTQVPNWTVGHLRNRETLLIGAVGNPKPVKGTDIFIEAAKKVLDRFPQVRFQLAGKGETAEYERRIEELGIAGQFEFLGSQKDIPAFLATLDIAVLPSRAEGLSNGLLEYMASGRPIVATQVGGNPELIQQERNGLLVPSEDAQALASAMERLIERPDFAEQLARQAREDVGTQYDARIIANQFSQLCEDIVTGKK